MSARRFYSSLADAVMRRRWWILSGYLLASAALGWLGSSIPLRSNLIDLLPEGRPSGADLRFYLERFGSADALFFRLRASGGDDLDRVERLEEAGSMLGQRLRETGLFRSVRHGYSPDEGLAAARGAMAHLPALIPLDRFEELRSRLEPGSMRERLERVRRRAAGPMMWGEAEALAREDPLGLLGLLPAPSLAAGPLRIDPGSGLFLSADASSLLLVALPLKPPQDMAFTHRLLEEAEAVEAKLRGELDGITVEHAGGYLSAALYESRIRHDVTATVTIAMAAVSLLLVLAVRRLSLLLILMLPLTLSMIWTLGIAAIYPGHLNVVSVAFAAILLGMGDDSLTHLYLRLREARGAGLGPADALRESMVSTGPSILVATLTTGLAFAALAFVEFRGLAELGIIAAIGLVNLLVSVMILFPCLLSFLPDAPETGRADPAVRIPIGPLVALHRWGRGHRRALLAGWAVGGILCAGAVSRLEFSSELREVGGEDEAMQRLEELLGPFGGLPDPVHLVQEAGDPDEALARAEALLPVAARLQEEGWISSFTSPASWIPSRATQQARLDRLAGIDWSAAGDRFASLAAQEGFNVEAFAPFLDHLARFGDREAICLAPPASSDAGGELPGLSGAVADTTLFPAPGRDPVQVARRARELAGGTQFRAAAVGLVVADLGLVIEQDFRTASLIAFAAVTLTAAASFRRPSRLLLVALPAAAGCLIMLAGLALAGIPINLMNLVATPLVFGLGVDFGVYMVNRHEEEGCLDVEKVLRHTGGAILLTGLTTLAGFGSLLSAQFAGLRSMGWVAVLGIGGSLVAALVLLPLLLPAAVRPGAGRS